MDEKKLNKNNLFEKLKNNLKKHLKLVIFMVITIIIAGFIVINKQLYTALTLIPTVVLAFLQSNEKQEELAKRQIEKFKKEQKEERFKKMLKFVFRTYWAYSKNREIIKMFEDINLYKLGRYFTDEERRCYGDPVPPDKMPAMTLGLLVDGCYADFRGFLVDIMPPDERHSYSPDLIEREKIFYKCLEKYAFDPFGTEKKEFYIDILRRELPKILNEDTFDFDKETWKNQPIEEV